ncbi:oxidoreductase [Xylariaceae sp. FL0804]|nr:oxidoreductase [Xylariaceae sp. FL0804]
MADLFPPEAVALVTGAAGTGIGAAVARAFVACGVRRLIITDIDGSLLAETRDSILSLFSSSSSSPPSISSSSSPSFSRPGPALDVIAIPGDVSSESFVTTQLYVDGDDGHFGGRLDFAVHCAGVPQRPHAATADTQADTFDAVNAVNYRGVWLCQRAALRRMMRKKGVAEGLVNIASQLGIVGKPMNTAYSASKAAVIALTRGDAIDAAAHGIRVNCVCPGVIETPMTVPAPKPSSKSTSTTTSTSTFTSTATATATAESAAKANENENENENEKEREAARVALEPWVRLAPLKRMGDPAEVADAVMFLCSTRASFVTGHALVVDGGYVLT